MRVLRSGHAAVSTILGILLYTHASASHHSDGILPYGNGNAPDVIRLDVRGQESREAPRVTDLDPNELDNLTATVDQGSELDRRAAKDFYLRVMPLGASITQGYKSSDGNGYRKWLRAQLRFSGWKVNMVGSERDGTMADSVSHRKVIAPVETWLIFARTTRAILVGPLSPSMAHGLRASG
jgi:hypothetical protein